MYFIQTCLQFYLQKCISKTKLRLSTHTLAGVTYRYRNIEIIEMFYMYCNLNTIEDKYIFVLLECPRYEHLRSKYFKNIYWKGPSVYKVILLLSVCEKERQMFYLTTHSTHFIYGYMASDIWLRTILIVRKETRCRHIGYSYRLTARVLLYAPSHRQDNTYHGLCYTSRGALTGTRNSSIGPPHEGSIRRPIAP